MRKKFDTTENTDHPIAARLTDFDEKRTCHQVDCTVTADDRVKIKENEKIDKYWDLFRELKKMWDTKRSVVSIVIGVIGTVPQRHGKKILGN